MRSEDLPVIDGYRRTPDEVPLGEVRRAIDELFALAAARRTGRSSPFGAQLAELQRFGGQLVSEADEPIARRAFAPGERACRYALLLAVWNRLTSLQQRVLEAQRLPCGTTTRIVQIRVGDLVAWSRRGAEVVGRMKHDRGRAVIANAGCIFVSESVPVYPRRAEIARELGVSVDQVRRASSDAYDVWRRFLSDSDNE